MSRRTRIISDIVQSLGFDPNKNISAEKINLAIRKKYQDETTREDLLAREDIDDEEELEDDSMIDINDEDIKPVEVDLPIINDEPTVKIDLDIEPVQPKPKFGRKPKAKE